VVSNDHKQKLTPQKFISYNTGQWDTLSQEDLRFLYFQHDSEKELHYILTENYLTLGLNKLFS
jgi:hypothetical protein